MRRSASRAATAAACVVASDRPREATARRAALDQAVAQATAAKLREANPSITNQEVADTLTDMLRMKRMKQQARILATKGCTSATIEQKLKEYWVDNKKIDMQKVEC